MFAETRALRGPPSGFIVSVRQYIPNTTSRLTGRPLGKDGGGLVLVPAHKFEQRHGGAVAAAARKHVPRHGEDALSDVPLAGLVVEVPRGRSHDARRNHTSGAHALELTP